MKKFGKLRANTGCQILIGLVLGTSLLVHAITTHSLFIPVDIRSVCNMAFRDETEGDKKGGWTDQGSNDLRSLPLGRQKFKGIPFEIINPAKNRRKSCIVLYGKNKPYFPIKTRPVSIKKKLAGIIFLHSCAWARRGETAAEYEIIYKDKEKIIIPIKVGYQISEWWNPCETSDKNTKVAWTGYNPVSADKEVGLFMYKWENPEKDKIIKKLIFRSKQGESVTGIVAVTGINISATDEELKNLQVSFKKSEVPVGEVKTIGSLGVPTFHCLGLYWSPDNGSSDNICQVSYLRQGESQWKQGLDFWFDTRNREYRGSIVDLTPGTRYKIKLSLQLTDDTTSFTATTWSEKFPIAQTVYLQAGKSNETLVINRSGTPYGYILYTHPRGKTSTIDVANNQNFCVSVNASYIIIRGLTLKGAKIHGIRLYEKAHDVVIEECDISGWGRIHSDGWGRNYDSAIYSNRWMVKRIIIQRNKFHHPRSDANSWKEYRKPYKTYHPMGPQVVTFFDSDGNHVIRYNNVYSDEEHYFNDIFGAGSNFSKEGFPNRDSDIYSNHIECCWDDGIESEGANCNVRIWGNYINKTYVKIACASTSIGPLYIWRNIADTSRKAPFKKYDGEHGPFLKAGGIDRHGTWYGDGKTYVFHNTLLQKPPDAGQNYPLGCGHGVTDSGGIITNFCSRNNIFHVHKDWWWSIRASSMTRTSDFDYDLYNGKIKVPTGQESNGIHGVPVYSPENVEGKYALAPSSPGYDTGIRIPNFNDDFTGKGPDIGAHEAGTPPMQFGVNAYRNTNIGSAIEKK